MKHCRVNLPSLNTTFWYFWDCTSKQVAKYLKKKTKTEKCMYTTVKAYTGNGEAVCFSSGIHAGSVIHFLSEPRAGLIAHETYHALMHTSRTIDIEVTEATEEIWAYALSHCVDEVVACLK